MAATSSSDLQAVIEKRVSEVVTTTLIQEAVSLGVVKTFSVSNGMDRLDIPLYNSLAVQAITENTPMTEETMAAMRKALRRKVPSGSLWPKRPVRVETLHDVVARWCDIELTTMPDLLEPGLGLLDHNRSRSGASPGRSARNAFALVGQLCEAAVVLYKKGNAICNPSQPKQMKTTATKMIRAPIQSHIC